MAVDDHGLEVLKKAAEEVTPGSKADYYIKVDATPNGISDPESDTGVSTRPTVTTTSSVVLAANADRKYAMIFNQSGTVVYLNLGDTAVVNQGIRLGNDQIFELTRDKLWTGSINAVRLAGSGEIEVFEGS